MKESAMTNDVSKQLPNLINLSVLFLGIICCLFFPVSKGITYGENVTILCSKGLSRNTALQYAKASTFSSTELQKLNTFDQVFNATIVDNSNSFLYNISLHWFTLVAGNSINNYVLFSRLLGALTLIVFFMLSRKIFKNSVFVSLAIIFVLLDPIFISKSIEVRAYMMSILFACFIGLYLYKILYEENSTLNFFWLSLFALCLLLSHYLGAYILVTCCLILLYKKKLAPVNPGRLAAVILPFVFFAAYLILVARGLKVMGWQNDVIAEALNSQFSYTKVAVKFMRYNATNFKVVFPAFIQTPILDFFSFLIVVIAYIVGCRIMSKEQKDFFSVLFLLGICSSVFMTVLSIYGKYMTPFNTRYFSFCIPFCCLFAAAFIQALYYSKAKTILKLATGAVLFIPVVYLAYAAIPSANTKKYKHAEVAALIEKELLTDVTVPSSRDALLINSFLQNNYEVMYHVMPHTSKFVASNRDRKYEIDAVSWVDLGIY